MPLPNIDQISYDSCVTAGERILRLMLDILANKTLNVSVTNGSIAVNFPQPIDANILNTPDVNVTNIVQTFEIPLQYNNINSISINATATNIFSVSGVITTFTVFNPNLVPVLLKMYPVGANLTTDIPLMIFAIKAKDSYTFNGRLNLESLGLDVIATNIGIITGAPVLSGSDLYFSCYYLPY